MIGICVAIVVALLLLFFLYPPFGKTPTRRQKKDYGRKAENFYKNRFRNEHDFAMLYRSKRKNRFLSNKGVKPVGEIPLYPFKEKDLKEKIEDSCCVTWLGHSTVLIHMHNKNIIIDPVFSPSASPLPFLGPRRYVKVPITMEDLPHLHIVIITHDHYDHLDFSTIKKMDNKVDCYLVPLGVENHLVRWGISKDKIISFSWWDEITLDGLKICCTPARHYSGRKILDSYQTLWSSWVLMDKHYKIFHSGDSGFDNHFAAIYERYGSFDFAMLDSGQYDVKWKSTHMTPEESVEASRQLKAKIIMPIHWGTFRLARHPWDDPVERFVKSASLKKIKYVTPRIGEPLEIDKKIECLNWWKDIK